MVDVDWQMIVTLAVVLVIVAGVIVLGLWSRRVEADVDLDPSNLSEEERRSLQLGIGLTSSTGLSGH